jgi:ComF family protein
MAAHHHFSGIRVKAPVDSVGGRRNSLGMVPLPLLTHRLVAAGRFALDALLPPRCLACGALTGAEAALCAPCWNRLAFIEAPLCACCGRPFEFAMETGALCAGCVKARPVYERARAVLRYDDASRPLILGFKHGDRTDSVPALAQWLARAGAELVADADAIVPVPLHWWRLFRRHYNQAALLANELGRLADKPVLAEVVRRRRATSSQGKLGAAERRRNVAGAFAVLPGQTGAIRSRRLLLIDDVLTTGATAEAVAETLLEAGAHAVDLLVLARVVRPERV